MTFHRLVRLAARGIVAVVPVLALAFATSATPTNAQQIVPFQNRMAASAPGFRTDRTIAVMQGTWSMSLTGRTGCGFVTYYIVMTLNAAGSGTGTTTQHTSTCGDIVTQWPFSITRLNRDGSGQATLSCGTGCGWGMTIQVSRDFGEFSLIDVSPYNPGNYLEGTAIRR